MNRNRLANVNNPYQRADKHKRVLCVCSAGLLRSPTMAYVLSQEPYNYNTRAAGIDTEFALIPVDLALVEWADEFVFAEKYHYEKFMEMVDPDGQDRSYFKCLTLDLPDRYDYRDKELVTLIRSRYDARNK